MAFGLRVPHRAAWSVDRWDLPRTDADSPRETDLGHLLPPGASGSLLRANAFFDGNGAGGPVLVLAVWVVAGLALMRVADRRNRRKTAVRSAV